MTETGAGVWAYAITRRGGDADLSLLAGIGGGVRAISAGELTALVSDVDLAEFGEAALRRNLENLDWLEEVARLHHRVIEAAGRQVPVLPMRLATVYSGDTAMAVMLAERGPELAAALDSVGGRVEWGVKAYALPAGTAGRGTAGRDAAGRDAAGRDAAWAQAEATTPADRGREAGGATSGDGAGLAYLRRRRSQLTATRESARSAVAGAAAVHAELARQSSETRLHPPQAPSLSGSRLTMVLNGAYLLDAGGETGKRFAAAVAEMASAHPELRMELTGPWPPYSFTGEDKQPPDDENG